MAEGPIDLSKGEENRRYLNLEMLKKMKVCDYSLTNDKCQRGADCNFIHLTECPNCKRNLINPFDELHLVYHVIDCEAMRFPSNPNLSKKEQELQCAICREAVWTTENKCFGVLSECSHVFCFRCILRWRCETDENGDYKLDCPVCRQDSAFIYPSRIWPANQEQKTEIEKRFMAALKQLHCKLFDFGRGHCILGERCIYKHQDQSELQI